MHAIEHEIAIIGGGFAGSLLSLRLADNGAQPVLIEPERHAGPGLAYGYASEHHLLNVPVQRMEIGLIPSFSDWIQSYPEAVATAMTNDGELAKAFVPRYLFGRYVREQVERAAALGKIKRVRGEVASVQSESGGYRLNLIDGRRLVAAKVVLATGNLAPAIPNIADDNGSQLADHPAFVPDPWAPDALGDLDKDVSVLLVGTGLTMMDVALNLVRSGHRGPIVALSRRGLMPLSHKDGGAWPASAYAGSPRLLVRQLREDARQANSQGVPWQRIIDTLRPHVAQVWAGWTQVQKAQFLRHLRPYWDVHRHRLAPVLARELGEWRESGLLVPLAGRIRRFASDDGQLTIHFSRRHDRSPHSLTVGRVVNCTGPQGNLTALGLPLFNDLQKKGLILPDALGLGLETEDARVLDPSKRPSVSLFAVGTLTRPAWWEVTAVPEIAAQVTRLAKSLTQVPAENDASVSPSLARDFSDLGAGI